MNSKRIILLILIIFTIFFSRNSFPQDTPGNIVDAKLFSINKIIKKDSVIDLKLLVEIKKGWHINSNKPLDPNLVLTVVSLDTSFFKIIEIKYPQPYIKKLSFSENELSLYENEAVIKIRILIDKNYKLRNLNVNGKIQYQPCNDQTCLFPLTKKFSADLIINDK